MEVVGRADVRPGPGAAARLDAIDEAILDELSRDGRIPNSLLAERVGVAPSTSLARVRALRARGVIRGFRADVSPEARGLALQAIVAVRLGPDARTDIRRFAHGVIGLPGVQQVFYVGGSADFLVHVAFPGTAELRDFVSDHLSADPSVAHTETSIVFEHLGYAPA